MELTQILETLARPGLLGIVGSTLEKRFQAELAHYFQLLGQRVAGLNLERHVASDSAEIARHAVEMTLSNQLRTMTPLLKAILESNLYAGLLAANKIHHFAEADQQDNPTSQLTGQEASLYASIRAGELVNGINTTTQTLIADTIEKGISEKLGVDGTAAILRQLLTDMSGYRARMIASTEMNDAFSEATMRKLQRVGVEFKQWIVSSACCDICAGNQDVGAIPVDEPFPSGDDRPPAHPNCRCAVSGARAPA